MQLRAAPEGDVEPVIDPLDECAETLSTRPPQPVTTPMQSSRLIEIARMGRTAPKPSFARMKPAASSRNLGPRSSQPVPRATTRSGRRPCLTTGVLPLEAARDQECRSHLRPSLFPKRANCGSDTVAAPD